MIVLIVFAFVAGVVTILSPCILPLLPILLGTSIAANEKPSKKRPLGIVVGFVTSFTFFTLFLTLVVRALGLSADILRSVAVVVFVLFGLVMVFPRLMEQLEQLWVRLIPRQGNSQHRTGFGGGMLIGLSLGLLWTPCVGPILAAVITLALTGTVTLSAVLITAAYAIGTAIPMFLIIYGGQAVTARMQWFRAHGAQIQRVFGVVMILTAVAIANNYDRKFQTYVLETLPGYGAGLTSIEDNTLVKDALDQITPQSEEKQRSSSRSAQDGQDYGMAAELQTEGEWFNSQPLTLAELRQQNKVVLIDFWTYSCINCQRTLPYLRDWWEKYADDGLVIIGVHAPEFEFEKDRDNVAEAIEDFGLEYPVVQDNDFGTWRAYNNRYWPAKYLIDGNGLIRYQHFGEGKYEETELMIQALLMEANKARVEEQVGGVAGEQVNRRKTPETYLGYGRMERFGSNEPIVDDELRAYTLPEVLGEDEVGYGGEWLVAKEYAEAGAGGILGLNFEAQKVFLVMNPVEDEGVVRIILDGEVVSEVRVRRDSLYELVELENAGRHELKLEFPDGGVRVFAFTFG